MTELNPPGFLQNAGATHTAQQMRLYEGSWQNKWAFSSQDFVPRSSRPYVGGAGVTAHTPNNMTVDVIRGVVFVRGSEATTQGLYTCFNDATVNLAIAAADPSLPRIDIVIARVRDSAYSGVTNSWALEVVTGTPAASPVAPVAPANSAVLSQVSVAAGATSITGANITSNPSTTIANFTSAMGGFEIVADKALYDFQGAPLWVANSNDEFWFEDFNSSNWRNFLTTLQAGRGINRGAVYQGVASLYSGTAEAVVSNMTIPSFDTSDADGFDSKLFGRVHIKAQSTVAGDRARFRVRIDSLAGAQIAEHNVSITATGTDWPVDFSYYYPSDGASHSLVLTCARDAGTGTINVVGAGTFNRFFHVVSEERGGNLVVV